MVGRLHGPVGPTGLRGRARDCALLDDLVAAIGRGESRWLVLWGEAGIGETALLDHMIASESDLTVVRAAGVDQGLRRRWRHGAGAPLGVASLAIALRDSKPNRKA